MLSYWNSQLFSKNAMQVVLTIKVDFCNQAWLEATLCLSTVAAWWSLFFTFYM